MAFDDIKKFTIDLLLKLPGKKLGEVIRIMLNKCDELENDNIKLKDENQKLKDEINRLKGEKGKPKIPKNNSGNNDDNRNNKDDNSKGSGNRGKNKKNKEIEVHESKEVDVDKDDLPKDAEYKGSRDVVIQDIDFNLKNIKFTLHKYYSLLEGKTFEGELPPEYKGSLYGPGIWSFIIQFHYEGRMTQNIIHKILLGVGVRISEGEISNIIRSYKNFTEEKDHVREAGIEREGFQQIDDTSTRLNGINGFSIATCNSFFTNYFTDFSKSRESALKALINSELKFMINDIALEYIDEKVSNKTIVKKLRELKGDQLYSEDEFVKKILEAPWLKNKIKSWIKHIKEGCIIGAYRANFLGVRSDILICDDAPQFKGILEYLGLCLIHEERHYKKLTPKQPDFIKAVEEFRKEFWDFYVELKRYKKNPTKKKKGKLSKWFDTLFSGETCYFSLNAQMKKTREKKEELLLVLEFPEIPLHNNVSELAMREKVIQRKIRGYFRSLEGARASDVFLSLMGSCRKLGLSFGEYLKDRFYHRYQIPPLGDLVWMA